MEPRLPSLNAQRKISTTQCPSHGANQIHTLKLPRFSASSHSKIGRFYHRVAVSQSSVCRLNSAGKSTITCWATTKSSSWLVLQVSLFNPACCVTTRSSMWMALRTKLFNPALGRSRIRNLPRPGSTVFFLKKKTWLCYEHAARLRSNHRYRVQVRFQPLRLRGTGRSSHFCISMFAPQRFATTRHLRFQGRHNTCDSDQAIWSRFSHLIATRMNMKELQLSFDLFCTAAYKGIEKVTRFLRRQINHKAEKPQIDSCIYFVDRY